MTLLFAPPAWATNCAVTCSARRILARNIAKYFSDPSVPSQIFSIKSLVPEMIWRRLFNSLATRGVMGVSPIAGFSYGSFMVEQGALFGAPALRTAAFAVPYKVETKLATMPDALLKSQRDPNL